MSASIRKLGSVLSLLAFAACAVPAPFEDHYESGAVQSRGTMFRGMQLGEWTYFWANGKPRAKGSYEDDVQVGPWTWWHENGNKSVTGGFLDEHSEGEWRYWHPNGKPHMIGFFARGQKTGEWSVFDGDGRMRERGSYAAGRRTGRWEFLHETGRPKAEGWFRDGVMMGRWSFFDAAGARSTKDYPVLDGVVVFGENWPDGTLRRAGLLERGEPHGRWITWHDNGSRRISGDFDRGEPRGLWRAFCPEGRLLAVGRVDAENPRGVWSVERVGSSSSDAARPPVVWSGVWTKASEFDAAAQVSSVERWFQEAVSSREKNVWDAPATRPESMSAPEPRTVAAVAKISSEPAVPPIFTRREIENVGEWLKAYTDDLLTSTFDMYDLSANRSKRRDSRRSNDLVGRGLAEFEFTSPGGTKLKLGASEGSKWTLLVVLRGFAGQVCPYCPVQLKALAPFRKEFEQHRVRVVAVYPGPRTGLDGFVRAYKDTFRGDAKPPYTIYYDEESRLAHELGVLETDPASAILARPTTLLLDSAAKVRYAYVGRHRADRPAAKVLLEKVRRLGRE